MAIFKKKNLKYNVFNPDQLTGIYQAPIISDLRAPTSRDIADLGTIWIDSNAADAYILTKISGSEATWNDLSGIPATGTDGQLWISGTGVTSKWANITSTGGSVTITNGANSINLEAAGVAALTQLDGDAGNCVPLAGVITIAGGTNIATTANSHTLTINLDASPSVAGSLTAATTVTAGTGITSTTGNIVATAGAVTAGTTITAGTGITSTLGNIVATAGTVNAGTTITAGTGITATTGNITASTGNIVSTAGSVTAATTITAGTGITSTLGDIVATAGAVTAGTTVTATSGNITATDGNIEAAAATKGFICGSGCKIIDGAGSPDGSVAAPKGSLYLRTDGSGVADRAYINTDGGTGWTNIVTAA